jgi:hypothetical protein
LARYSPCYAAQVTGEDNLSELPTDLCFVNNVNIFGTFRVHELKDIAATIQSLVTTAAILLGGIWSYFLFVRKRQARQRVQITHRVFHKIITKSKALLHITIIVSNVGEVLIRPQRGEMKVLKILPLTSELLNRIEEQEGFPYLENLKERELDLPQVSDLSKFPDNVRIEPGETEEIGFDFIINSEVKLIKIESFFENRNLAAQKSSHPIGWRLSTIHDLEEQSDSRG